MVQRPDELTDADIERVLAVLRTGSFDSVELEVDGVRIVASNAPTRTAPKTVVNPPASVVRPEPPVASPPHPTQQPTSPTVPLAERSEVSAEETVASPEFVTAPMAGIFYRRPSPDAAPFVEVGAAVPAGETIGLIEVMKLFTAIKADRPGILTEFLAADGEQVVKDQPLIRLGAEQAT